MMLRWAGRIAAVLAGVAALAVLGGFLFLRTSLPQLDGSVAVAGPTAPVEILRDANGVVTIRAASGTDGYFGLGFAHAQDRLFQMEFMRRYGAGRLSEVIGPATLDLDRRMRVLGLYARAEAGRAVLSPEVQAALDAYAAGVNAYLDGARGTLPPAFHLLRHAPEPWRPADSLVWGRLMALQLSGNWREELFRFRLAALLPPARLEALWPARPGRMDTSALDAGKSSDVASRESLMAALAGLPASFGRIPGASNSWAVDGRYTASGKPLLANDPHLRLSLPAPWYLARIETPEGVVAGATAPGVPFVVIGHNGRVAWSFTTTAGDTQDLFIERLVPGRPDSYLTPDGPRPLVVHEETIEVRGAPAVSLAVRETRHGPVISDAGLTAGIAGDDEVVALAWPGLRTDDMTAEALYRMGHAADAAALREALRLFHSPQQNIVYADTAGAIGFVAAGRVPVRKALSAGSQMPAPGWSGDYDWSGFLPFDALPQILKPASGRIVTANNDITPPDYPHFIAARWEAPFRAERIEAMLEGRHGLTAAEMGAMQMDELSLPARELLPRLLAALPPVPDGPAAEALSILRGWDYRMAREQPAPLIFVAWMGEIDRRLFGAELGPLYDDFVMWNGNGAGTLLAGLRGSGTGGCVGGDAAPEPACRKVLLPALEAAVAALADAYGPDPQDWRWGAAHRARFAHPVLDRLPLIADWAAHEIATGGGNFTVSRGTAIPGPGMTFRHVHGASLRAVFDLADLDRSLFMIPGGQSGNPLSPHFDDLVEPWRDGRFLTIVEPSGGDDGTHRLRLTPGGR